MPILDIKAKEKTGRWINVEMQIGDDLYFDKRAIYYWSKLVTEQLSEGRMYKELQKTISINILGFNFVPDDSVYHNCYKIINIRTKEDDKLHDIFELYYIELKKFKKKYNEIATALDRWATFMTRAHEIDKNNIPQELLKDKAIIKAIAAVDRMFDEEERSIYESRMEAIANIESRIASANEKGMEKGMEKGIEKGIEKERIKRKKDKQKMIQKMHQADASIEFIAQVTELKPEDIKVILDDNTK